MHRWIQKYPTLPFGTAAVKNQVVDATGGEAGEK